MMWKAFSRLDASTLSEEWNSFTADKFNELMEDWETGIKANLSADYLELRRGLIKLHSDASAIVVSGIGRYQSDLSFGIGIYKMLRDEYDMNSCIASDDDIWRYIQMRVVPDIIFERWSEGEGKNRINDSRFWRDPRRIWLKTLWWYIHLSLQNESLEETKSILQHNGSDDISQLVERSGSGYRIELYRSIMRRYSTADRSDGKLLRKVLKLNVIRCATVEPLFASDDIIEYVEDLFNYFGA